MEWRSATEGIADKKPPRRPGIDLAKKAGMLKNPNVSITSALCAWLAFLMPSHAQITPPRPIAIDPPEAFDPPNDLWVETHNDSYQKIGPASLPGSIKRLASVLVHTANAAKSITGAPRFEVHGLGKPVKSFNLPAGLTYSDGSCSLGSSAIGDSVTCLGHDSITNRGPSVQIVREGDFTLRVSAVLRRGVWKESTTPGSGTVTRTFSGRSSAPWDTLIDLRHTGNPDDTLVLIAPAAQWRLTLDWTLVIGPNYEVNVLTTRTPPSADSLRPDIKDPPRNLKVIAYGDTFGVVGKNVLQKPGKPPMTNLFDLVDSMRVFAENQDGGSATLPSIQKHRQDGGTDGLQWPLPWRSLSHLVGPSCSDFKAKEGDTLVCTSNRKKGVLIQRVSAYEVKLSAEFLRGFYGPQDPTVDSNFIRFRGNYVQWDTVIQMGKALVSDTLGFNTATSESRLLLPFALGLQTERSSPKRVNRTWGRRIPIDGRFRK
jgi:hypothetical protein